MTTNIPSNILNSIRASGFYPFRHESCNSDYNAEVNLKGRSHFANPETLRYFKSRILDSYHSHDGLVFWLVESNRSKPFESAKNKRFIAFDIFGTRIFESEWHKTSSSALKEGKAWLASFDAVEHTEKALRARATYQAENAKSIVNALEGVK